MNQCPNCQEFLYKTSPHTCVPYEVEWWADGDVSTKYGTSAEDVADKWARNYNEDGDYALMNETETLKITGPDGVVQFFKVGAEPDIHYSVEPCDEPKADDV